MKITIILGSLRKESYNKKLMLETKKIIEKEPETEITIIDPNEYELPLFNEDLEKEGTPENALKIKKEMKESQGIIIISPEYNSSYPAVLKNIIDWASRPAKEEKPYEAFKNKTYLIMAASPSQGGGNRVIEQLKRLITNMKGITYPEHISIREAHKAFNKEGLKDERKKEELTKTIKEYLEFTKKLNK